MRNIQARTELEELLKNEKNLIVDWTASWCGPCQQVKPILEWVEDAYKKQKLVVVAVDTDKFSKLHEEFGVKAIPNICFMRDGKVVKRFVGVPKMEAFRAAVREYLGLGVGAEDKWVIAWPRQAKPEVIE